MIIGDYTYEGRGTFKRITREVKENELFNADCPILKSDKEIKDWLEWKTIDKFWEKVW
jgi:hypothetical protein